MAKGFIIAGYPGVGKTTFCSRTSYDRTVDLESSYFKSKEAWDEANWEQKYVAKAIDLAYEGAIVFISTHELVLKELDRMAGAHGVFAAVVFPSLDLEDWWVKKLNARYSQDPSDKNMRASLRAKEYYYSDIKRIMTLCEQEGSNLFEAKITKKEYNIKKIVEELKKINNDLYGEDNMSKIEFKSMPFTLEGNELKFDTDWLKGTVSTYSASESVDNNTITDGEEHPDTDMIHWETDKDGNYTGAGYMYDKEGHKSWYHDLVYRPHEEGKIMEKNVDILKAIELITERLDKIEKNLSGKDKYIWPEAKKRDGDYMEKFFMYLINIWKDFPDMRFGQFIGNVIQDPALYYIEDDKLIETLKKYYNDLMGNKNERKD